MDSEVAHEEIVQGNLELGVITLSPTRHERLKAMPIWHDQLTFVCAVDHPLADTSSIDVETLAGYAAILPDMSTFTGRIVKQMFDQKGLTLILSMSTNYLETIKMLISVQRGTRLYRPVTREHRFLAGSRCSRKSSESNSITCTRLRDLPFSRQTIHGTDWPPKRRTALANLIALRRKGPSSQAQRFLTDREFRAAGSRAKWFTRQYLSWRGRTGKSSDRKEAVCLVI